MTKNNFITSKSYFQKYYGIMVIEGPAAIKENCTFDY